MRCLHSEMPWLRGIPGTLETTRNAEAKVPKIDPKQERRHRRTQSAGHLGSSPLHQEAARSGPGRRRPGYGLEFNGQS